MYALSAFQKSQCGEERRLVVVGNLGHVAQFSQMCGKPCGGAHTPLQLVAICNNRYCSESEQLIHQLNYPVFHFIVLDRGDRNGHSLFGPLDLPRLHV